MVSGTATAVGGAAGGSTSANPSTRGSPAVGSSANNGAATATKSKATPVNSNGYHPSKPHNPLSSMRSAPLDLTSVERRGQATATREPVQRRNRPHGLEEAPTYYPTKEEFKDPMQYIRMITPEAIQYGICKIVPPDSWNPTFAIDTEKFHFRTRKQELNSVEGSTRANLSYLDALWKFHKQQGTNMHRLPYVDKKPLDLYRLKKAVESRGGFEKVCKDKKWAEIGRDLGYSGKIMSSLSTSLKNSYSRWLCPYEEYLRVAKPGVHQQLELENGGPFTPSPAPSPMKRSNIQTPSSLRDDSPARLATDVLQASLNGQVKDGDRDTPMSDVPAQAQSATSGFTAINSGGFTAVNAGFTSVNRIPAADSKPSTPAKQNSTPFSSSKNTPEYRPSGLGPANALKRQMSCDSLDSAKKECAADKNEGEGGNRRSKRLKKDNVPTVAGSHMSQFRPSVPRIPKEEDLPPGQRCEQCGKGSSEIGFLAVCESCDHGYHGACLEPPLKVKPEGEWNCPRCLVGDGQFGFEEGGLYSLKEFQEKAANFKQGYFEKKMPFDPVLNCHRPVTEDDVEREFWRLVSSLEDTVEVEYGADIHCTTHGSGFPTVERNPDDPYSTDPWNLNLLPLHSDSLFKHIQTDISGMTVPWVYVGMIFSTFCWHNEDHYAYSANYQHFGATKTWYGIPGEDAEKFELAMREAVPELFETQPDLLFQLVTLLPPEHLKKAGVRVYAVDQRAGQFVITFPQAYHAGFNHGFNFNEAVNFAPSDWEPYGLSGVERLQSFRRQPCFSHDELLWTAAEGITSGGVTIQTAKWLAPALERIKRREQEQREAFVSKHLESSSHRCILAGAEEESCPLTLNKEDVDVPEEEYQCAFCKAFTYLSRFKCVKSGQVLCLQHAGCHSCCDTPEEQRFFGKDHVLFYRKPDDIIAATYKRVADKANLPQAWEAKYEKMLDEEATPSLKTLRALLSEGEKIPYDLPSLPMLKDFVDRCNRWVDEATTYIVRKQQNRRKNEKAWQSGMRKSIGSSQQEEKERAMRDVSNIFRLLDEAEQIGFDCPEIQQLKERSDAVTAFQENATRAVQHHHSAQTVETIEELLDEGHGFNVDMPQLEQLSRLLDQMKWDQKAENSRSILLTLSDVQNLIEEAKSLDIALYNDHFRFYNAQLEAGMQWEKKALELIKAETVHYPQLEALSSQATSNALPVSQETLAAVDHILQKQRDAHRQIIDLNKRSRDEDYTKRPKYAEVAEIMKRVEDLQSKPAGTLDLDREQKRHEDWMRRGKRLFGKTNAPLHILKSYMNHVLEKNRDCFDTAYDKPRLPAEPASREPSPSFESQRFAQDGDGPRSQRDVFCICRRAEAGMMIECEICHEWYHGKCLKLARCKLRDEVGFTCPVCDWRVGIPRDAARPNLEDLISWCDEIPGLPFQPEEEDVLRQIIDDAQEFRNHIAAYCNPILSTSDEAETQRFYLRKIEGAEILLAYETNFFRQELHKWCPVAPVAPPVIEVSKSTRKPRPTKLQKMLQQYGVEDPDDLPESVKGKANSLKRKAMNAEAAAAAAASSGSHHMGSAPGSVYGSSRPFFGRSSSSQPQASGMTLSSSSHSHPRSVSNASSSSHHGSGQFNEADRRHSTPQLNSAAMDIDNSAIHPAFFTSTGASAGSHLLMGDNSIAMPLEGRLDVHYGDNVDPSLQGGAAKAKALEILSRTDSGRRRAEEIFGKDVWNSSGHEGSGTRHNQHDENDENVDRMFDDLVNQDEEEEGSGIGKNKEIENKAKIPNGEELEKDEGGEVMVLDD